MSNDSGDDAESDEVEQVEEHAEEESQEETDESGENQDEAEGLQYGEFVRVDYVARTVDDGSLVDTTDPAVAEDEGIETDRDLEPRTIVLGEGHVFEAVEESIIGSEVGDTGTVVVPAAEAFGEYDEEKVRTVSKDKIAEDDQYPGAQVTIDGEQGFVETIIGGRARVDFNHPLAGDDIEYEWELLGTVDDREEQARGLLSMFLDLELDVRIETDTVEEEQLVEDDDEDADADDDEVEETDEDDESTDEDAGEEDAEEAEDDADDDEPTFETVEVEKETLYIDATPELTMNQQWMFQKQQIGQQLISLLDIDRIIIQEVIEGGGFPGMMGGLGGMGGGDIEAALEEADIDADDLADEL